MTSVFWRTTGATLAVVLLLAACVTINVYFPAAAVEQAADRIIEDVWGRQPGESSESSQRPAQAVLYAESPLVLIRSARAQADINISTPAIEALKQSMADRFRQHLEPLFDSGALGLTADGLIAVRDAGAAPLNQRGQLAQLVEQHNRDLRALYREIARANGQPEWESRIQATFAERWIGNARSGWWYQSGGSWRQK